MDKEYSCSGGSQQQYHKLTGKGLLKCREGAMRGERVMVEYLSGLVPETEAFSRLLDRDSRSLNVLFNLV